jgi:hypothetical protein
MDRPLIEISSEPGLMGDGSKALFKNIKPAIDDLEGKREKIILIKVWFGKIVGRRFGYEVFVPQVSTGECDDPVKLTFVHRFIEQGKLLVQKIGNIYRIGIPIQTRIDSF